jgi:hypothetical protein
MPAQTTAGKQQRGRPFGRGVSGNPAGRRKGSRNRATIIGQALTETDRREIIGAVVAKAKQGNLIAAKIVLDRLWPTPKGRTVALALPPAVDANSIMQAHSAVVHSLASGAVTPDEAEAISRILAAHLRVIETAEIERRLQVLEDRQAREIAR